MADQNTNRLPINYDEPWNEVIVDGFGQDAFLVANGCRFKHYKALPCVLGQPDEGGIRHSHTHEQDGNSDVHCENNFVYVYAGEVFGVFTGNSKQQTNMAPGFLNNSTAMVTFNRYYRGTDKLASFTEYDKLIPCESPKEFFHSNFEKLEHNPQGIDRCQFKITEMEFLYDSDGKFYNEGTDFVINSLGQISWTSTGNRPGFSNVTDKPKIISVRYKYSPYFYVKQMMHEVRIVPQVNPYTGEMQQKKMPMQALVQVDWVFLQDNTEKTTKADKEIEEPVGTNGGPR